MRVETRGGHLLRGMLLIFCSLGLVVLGGCRVNGSSWTPARTIPFSPDDRAVAYTHMGAVYVARTSGDESRRVYQSESDVVVSTPHWAPRQRGLIFAVADSETHTPGGLVEYTVWYWPAPEEIWTEETEDRVDSVELPVKWRPDEPVKLLSARCSHAIQIAADALFAWHPDGQRLLYLDTDGAGLQTLRSFDVGTGESGIASPVSARSLAFAIAPRGEQLHIAAADAETPSETASLWVGPLGADKGAWRRIESSPGPWDVPSLELEEDDGTPWSLYDLRPRLGTWSPDAKWLAHTRLPAVGPRNDGFQLVLTPINADDSQRIIEIPRGQARDLHWQPGGQAVGLLNDERLIVVSPRTGQAVSLASVLGVERFMGWSEPGDYLAYLVLAESFPPAQALLPTGDRIRWAPTDRHNVMVAGAQGTSPRNRFGMMNITAAQWGNRSNRLSFWATYLPTVSLLPPGDPAAVLDLEEDKIRWYPTNLAEYAHVGHYYLLSGSFQTAATHYGRALEKLTDEEREEFPDLEWSIHLWRAVAGLAGADEGGASRDLRYVRGHVALPEDRARDLWEDNVLRALIADRSILATMLSMGQIELAIAEAKRIAENDTDARRVQALCILALIYDSLGQGEAYAERVAQDLLPATLASRQIPGELADELIDDYLTALVAPSQLRRLSSGAQRELASALAELAREAPAVKSATLFAAAAVVYRETGDAGAELSLLRSWSSQASGQP